MIELLNDSDGSIRMLALHLLCEGYATSPEIMNRVFEGWKTWDAATAFPEFPMLSHLPIDPTTIGALCERAEYMVDGRKLTDPSTRCAGKMIEQLVLLPAHELAPYQSRLEDLKTKSKIFFRVNLVELEERLQLLNQSADSVAAVLDDSIARLVDKGDDSAAFQRGLAALEALRREHPEYLDLTAVFQARQSVLAESSDATASPSFLLTLQSLIQFEQAGTEECMSKHLNESQESIYANTVEALVRAGTHAAFEGLIDQFSTAPAENQKWIARGLQRFRGINFSPKIAELRDGTTDPILWLMLLIAEVRQFEPESADKIAQDLARLQSPSEALFDSLKILCSTQ